MAILLSTKMNMLRVILCLSSHELFSFGKKRRRRRRKKLNKIDSPLSSVAEINSPCLTNIKARIDFSDFSLEHSSVLLIVHARTVLKSHEVPLIPTNAPSPCLTHLC